MSLSNVSLCLSEICLRSKSAGAHNPGLYVENDFFYRFISLIRMFSFKSYGGGGGGTIFGGGGGAGIEAKY